MKQNSSINELRNKNPPYPPYTANGATIVHWSDLIKNGRTIHRPRNIRNWHIISANIFLCSPYSESSSNLVVILNVVAWFLAIRNDRQQIYEHDFFGFFLSLKHSYRQGLQHLILQHGGIIIFLTYSSSSSLSLFVGIFLSLSSSEA